MSKTLNQIAKTDKRVSAVEDIGLDEESRYWVYLKQGWFSPMDGSHTITARTVKEARESLSQIEPCNCLDCKSQ